MICFNQVEMSLRISSWTFGCLQNSACARAENIETGLRSAFVGGIVDQLIVERQLAPFNAALQLKEVRRSCLLPSRRQTLRLPRPQYRLWPRSTPPRGWRWNTSDKIQSYRPGRGRGLLRPLLSVVSFDRWFLV